ncbi:disulfide bond formation protein B [Halovulum sp. GXIMD14793]
MSARTLTLLAAGGSAVLFLGALGFQYLADMAPCKLCIWQRWPHGIAIVLGLLYLVAASWRPLLIFGALAALTTAGIGVYHAGVEQHWWPGPDTCTSGPVADVSTDELFNQIMAAPLVRCDEIPWSMLGISMAGWNAIASIIFAGLWLVAWRRAST